MPDAKTYRWEDLAQDHPMPSLGRRRIIGEKMMISEITLHEGCRCERDGSPAAAQPVADGFASGGLHLAPVRDGAASALLVKPSVGCPPVLRR